MSARTMSDIIFAAVRLTKVLSYTIVPKRPSRSGQESSLKKTFGEAPGHTLARRVRARGRRLRDPDKCICQCYSRRATGGSAWYPLAHARLSPTTRIKTRGGWISQRGRARARANNLKESARAVLIAHEINPVERRGRGTLRCGARSHRPDSCPEVSFCSTNVQMWGSKHPNR